MTIKQILDAIEAFSPVQLQDGYDNAGLQVGNTGLEVSAVLVCLDITEEIVDEAVAKGCNLIVSHHPLIFKALKKVSDATYQQRCVVKAIKNDITIYSAHTNLDNAEDGVNYRIASLLGLENISWLDEKPVTAGRSCGSGIIASLPVPEDAAEFLMRVKKTFRIESLMHSAIPQKKISRVAICGGAGGFLLGNAIAAGADCFLTGELSYHSYFDNDGVLVAAMGHYQSEQFTKDLLCELIRGSFPSVRVEQTAISTNPIHYM